MKAAEAIIRNKYLNQDLHRLKNRLRAHEAQNLDQVQIQVAGRRVVQQVGNQEDKQGIV